MQRSGCGRALAAALLGAALAAGDAEAFQYSLLAEAGSDGDSTNDVDVPSVSSNDINAGPNGQEAYTAFASGSGGVSASAAWEDDPPSATISHRAVARVSETIRLTPFPSGPVTVTVWVAGDVGALSSGTGVARATAQVELDNGACSASLTANSVLGRSEGSSCPTGSTGSASVTRTFTLQELGARNYEINVAAQADAVIEPLGPDLVVASAQAQNAIYLLVSGGTNGHTYSSPHTSFLVPEPAGAALGVVALASLATRARRTRRARLARA